MGSGLSDDDFDEAVRRFMAAAAVPDAPHEPSAAERDRAARQADLVQRLAAQEDHDRRLAQRNRKRDLKQGRRSRRARWLGPMLLVTLVAIAVYLATDRGAGTIAGSPELNRPSDWPPRSDEVTEAPLGTPPALPAETGPFEFLATHDDDTPVTWDPCRPIHYVVNPAGQPDRGQELIEAAVGRATSATGLRFVNDGATDEPWAKDRDPYLPDRYGERWAPVLIAWSTQEETPQLGGYVAGLGGPSSVGLRADDRINVSGSIVLDAADLGDLLTRAGGPAAAQAVVQHELGHLVGLDHVADPNEIMVTEGSPTSATDWGPGDLDGLHALGSGACHPEI